MPDQKIVMVPVTWQMRGFIPVKINKTATKLDAVNIVENKLDEFSLPDNATYVDASLCIATGNTEACAEMAYVRPVRE